jgi:hypothetical protein
MLWISSSILLLLWLAAVAMGFTAGGFVHLLLMLAVAVVLVQLMEADGRGSRNRSQKSSR